MKKIIGRKLFIGIMILTISIAVPAYAKSPAKIYSKAIKLIKKRRPEFALFAFRRILKEYPDSKFAEKALFGVGEIYFSMTNYRDANKSFIKHIKFYPDSDAKLFSLVYLLKLSRISKNESLVESLEKKILSFYQLSFLFRDFKEYEYRSPSFKAYKAVYYIDKVEFSIGEDKFEKISY